MDVHNKGCTQNDDAPEDVRSLELVSVIGFGGNIPGGLVSHPDGHHIVYPLGCTVIVEDVHKRTQTFLSGHSDNVSCLACSPSGSFIASGQVTHMGFKADVIVWRFEERELYCRLSLHMVKVQAVTFSPNDKFLATLGGQDDNSVVIWDLDKKEAVCGSQAAMQSAGPVYALAYCNTRDDLFVTGGNHTLRVWELNPQTRKIVANDCNLGQLKRIVQCIQVSPDDGYMFCGTSSGDVLQVNLSTQLIQYYGPQKNKLSCGVQALQLLPNGKMVVGSGDGTLAVLLPSLKRSYSTTVSGSVSSVALTKDGKQLYVGTHRSNRYLVQLEDLTPQLISSSHCSAVTDISFPLNSSELFATSSYSDVKVWHANTGKELLRVSTPNITCHAVTFTPDGKAIITAWEDGKIRAYYPQSGRTMYTIHDAHNKGVTALACTSDSHSVISGGGEGQVRVWEISSRGQHMVAALKEHTGTITCIKLRSNDEECVTASTDGTCIIWDLIKLVRSQVIFANTMFHSVCYRLDECQIITAGTDRKIGYWEAYDGGQIRELDGSKTASINGMDICGTRFVSGGGDKLIKVWDYGRGEVTHVGVGHSGEISKVKVAPDGCHVVSVSVDGAILRWKMPSPKQ